MAERDLQGGCPQLEAARQAIGNRTAGAADQLTIVLEWQRLQLQGLVHGTQPEIGREHPMKSETIQVLDLGSAGTQVTYRCVHAVPGVEGGNGKARCWIISHARIQVRGGV